MKTTIRSLSMTCHMRGVKHIVAFVHPSLGRSFSRLWISLPVEESGEEQCRTVDQSDCEHGKRLQN